MTCTRLVVTLGAVWLIFQHINSVVLLDLFASADPIRLAFVGIILLVQFMTMVWRWQIVINVLNVGSSIGRTPLVIALGRSMLIGQLLPSAVGSDVVRTVVLSRELGLAFAVRSVACDRILALAVLLALIVATLPLFALVVDRGPAFGTIAAVSLGSLATFVLLLLQPRWLFTVPWFKEQLTTVVGDLRRVFVRGQRGPLALLLALATHLFSVLLIHQLAHAMGTQILLVDCLLVVPATLLISSVPISLGGWGVREGALSAGFVMVGASSAAGVATSVLYGLTGPLIGLIIELASPLMRPRETPPKNAA